MFYFILGLIRLLIPSVVIKLINVYESDPDFVEYAKPKARVKVGVLYSVNIYKGADT